MNALHVLASLLFGMAAASAIAQPATGQSALIVVAAAHAMQAKPNAWVVLEGTVVCRIEGDNRVVRPRAAAD